MVWGIAVGPWGLLEALERASKQPAPKKQPKPRTPPPAPRGPRRRNRW